MKTHFIHTIAILAMALGALTCAAQGVEPLLTTSWTQSAPYNKYCPPDPVYEADSYAGCPAVAMGMIINNLHNTLGTRMLESDCYQHDYDGRYYHIDHDWAEIGFPSFAKLNTMLDSIDSLFALGQDLDDDLAAALIFACGTALRQIYTASASGTFSVAQAYEAYQRFGFSSARLLTEADEAMHQALRSNLDAGYAAHLAIEDAAGRIGHNVVVDGYRPDGSYHMNFGYGGAYDGWYSIPDASMPYGMDRLEGIVLDIFPSGLAITQIEAPSFSLSPNPSRGEVRILNPGGGSCSITLIDLLGRTVMRHEMNSAEKTLPLAGIVPGTYCVALTSGSHTAVQKLIIR